MITDEIISQKFLEFKPIADKLHSQGFSSFCEVWWRSRYYDSYLYPNGTLSKNGWEWATFSSKCWEFIWDKYETFFTKKIMPQEKDIISIKREIIKPKQLKLF